MAKVTLLVCMLYATYCFASAGILNWLKGSEDGEKQGLPLTAITPLIQPPTLSGGKLPLGTGIPNSAIPNQNPEESGECSHWGDSALPSYSSNDPMSHAFEYNKGQALPGELIGSHTKVPVGSLVAVTNMRTGNTVTVRVVPPKTIPVFRRVMDLSPAAFSQVASLREGVFTCSVRVVSGSGTQMHALSSYTVDNGQINVRPSSMLPTSPTHLGSSVGGMDMFGSGRPGGQHGIGTIGSTSGILSPQLPVLIGNGYNNHQRNRLPGLSSVTAYDPDGRQLSREI